MEAVTKPDPVPVVVTTMYTDNVHIIHRDYYFCCIIKEGSPVAKIYGTTPEKCKEQAELIMRLLNDEEKRQESNRKQEDNQCDDPI
jgi:hypothetical protein